MSAPILQHGDQIHLALPVSPMLTEKEAEARSRKDADDLAAIYAKIGVSILCWSAHSNLGHPVVVAVFRYVPPAASARANGAT